MFLLKIRQGSLPFLYKKKKKKKQKFSFQILFTIIGHYQGYNKN